MDYPVDYRAGHDVNRRVKQASIAASPLTAKVVAIEAPRASGLLLDYRRDP